MAEKIEIVDKYGNKYTDIFKQEKLDTEAREKIALNIFSHMLNSEEKDQFVASAINYLGGDSAALTVEDGKLRISMDDPDFQNFCILYATEKVITQVLDENLLDAYTLLAELTNAQKYNNSEDISLDEDDLKELEKYYLNAPELILAKQVCDLQLEINQTMNGQSGKILTSYQANRIQEKFGDLVPYLNPEQRAAGYYNISIIHRALLAEKDIYDPQENNAEKECLKKVLEYTSDYKRISYCENRLKSSGKDQGLIRSAYRRALTAAEDEEDLFNINNALAECYVNDFKPIMGYRSELQEKENEKLLRAEMYYKQALEHAEGSTKLGVLKKIGKVQLRRGDIPAWTSTQTTLAMKFMEGEERCHALLDVARKSSKYAVQYLDRVIHEAEKSKKINKAAKSVLIHEAAQQLKNIYTMKNDQKALEELEERISKYMAKNVDENPLSLFPLKGKSK